MCQASFQVPGVKQGVWRTLFRSPTLLPNKPGFVQVFTSPPTHPLRKSWPYPQRHGRSWLIPFPSPKTASGMGQWLNRSQRPTESPSLGTSGKDFPLPYGTSRNALSSSRLRVELRGLELQQPSLGWHEDTEEGRAKTFTWKWVWQLQVMLYGPPFHFLASILLCANTSHYLTNLNWMFPTSIWRQLFKDRQNLCASEFII